MKIGIYGYGNLGRGIENAIKQNDDLELAAVFTRRDPSTVTIKTEGVPVVKAEDVLDYKDMIDVMVICGGSATDLPVRLRSSQRISTSSTVSTPMRTYLSIIRTWTRLQRLQDIPL